MDAISKAKGDAEPPLEELFTDITDDPVGTGNNIHLFYLYFISVFEKYQLRRFRLQRWGLTMIQLISLYLSFI